MNSIFGFRLFSIVFACLIFAGLSLPVLAQKPALPQFQSQEHAESWIRKFDTELTQIDSLLIAASGNLGCVKSRSNMTQVQKQALQAIEKNLSAAQSKYKGALAAVNWYMDDLVTEDSILEAKKRFSQFGFVDEQPEVFELQKIQNENQEMMSKVFSAMGRQRFDTDGVPVRNGDPVEQARLNAEQQYNMCVSTNEMNKLIERMFFVSNNPLANINNFIQHRKSIYSGGPEWFLKVGCGEKPGAGTGGNALGKSRKGGSGGNSMAANSYPLSTAGSITPLDCRKTSFQQIKQAMANLYPARPDTPWWESGKWKTDEGKSKSGKSESFNADLPMEKFESAIPGTNAPGLGNPYGNLPGGGLGGPFTPDSGMEPPGLGYR